MKYRIASAHDESDIYGAGSQFEPVTHQHPCRELTLHQNQRTYSAEQMLQFSERFVDILRWVSNPNTHETKLRKLAILNAILDINPSPDMTWSKLATDYGCGRACISRLAAQFQRQFGEVHFGPVRPGMKNNWKGKQ